MHIFPWPHGVKTTVTVLMWRQNVCNVCWVLWSAAGRSF